MTQKGDRLVDAPHYSLVARGLNDAIDNMTWQDAQRYARAANQWAIDRMTGVDQTLRSAFTEPPQQMDIAQGLNTGIREAIEGTAGLPGMIGSGTAILRDMLAQRMGLDPANVEAAMQLWRKSPGGWAFANAPSSEQVEQFFNDRYGPKYEPTSGLGQVGRFAGNQFDPMTLLPGGEGYKAMRGAL